MTVLIGPTQHGKSTVVQLLVKGGVAVATGKGDGLSCTTKMTLYEETLIGQLLDTMGFNDTHMRLTNMVIAQELAAWLIKHDFQGVKFIVVNSLVDQAMSVVQTLTQFNLVFPNALQSVLVLATQVDKVSPESEVPLKWFELERKCQEVGVGQQMKWQSYKDPQKTPLDDAVFQAQILKLQTKLKALEPYTPQKASDLQARIDQKMDAMHKDHGTQTDTRTEDVEEDYIEEYEDEEEVPVQTSKTTFETIRERVPLPDTRMEQIEVPALKWIIPILNIPIEGTRRETFPVNTTKWEWVERKVPVVNSDTQMVTKKVKKQRVSKRTVPKTVTVTADIPRENFRAAAKDAILKENEEQMKTLIASKEAAQSVSLNPLG